MSEWNGYRFTVELAHENYPELMPLYAAHYAEMKERLFKKGVDIPEFAPRIADYIGVSKAGMLLNLVVRKDGEAVGYCNVHLFNDMHNSEPSAAEDTVFIRKDHRKGVGKKLVEFGLNELRKRGAKSLSVQALTDPRIVSLWQRMGFKPVATCMIYRFED